MQFRVQQCIAYDFDLAVIILVTLQFKLNCNYQNARNSYKTVHL